MKIFTLLVALAIGTMSMAANPKPHHPLVNNNNVQSVPYIKTSIVSTLNNKKNFAATNRSTNSTASRIIGAAGYDNNGSTFYVYDSIVLGYPSANVGNDLTNVEYAPRYSSFTEYGYNTISDMYYNDEVESITYNSNWAPLTEGVQYWDNNTSQYRNYEQYIFTYNGTQITKELVQYWDTTNSQWVNSAQTLLSYSGNNETQYTVQGWSTFHSAFVNDYQYNYTYDGNNNETSQVEQDWDTTGTQWVNNYEYTFAYDANNNDTTETSLDWSGSWTNYSKYKYTYNSNHYNTSEIDQYWAGSAWANEYEYDYTYTGTNETQETDFYWDNVNTVWDKSYQYLYMFDANNNDTTDLDQAWNIIASQWINTYKYKYDFSGNTVTSEVDQDTIGNGFINQREYLYGYNSYNQETSEITSTWNIGGSIWEATSNDYKDYYYYQTYTGVPQLSELGDITAYPNPASNYIHTSISLHQISNLQLRLVNMMGQTVWTTNVGNVQQYMANIPVTDLTDGVYMLQVNSGDATQTQKIVVQR